MPTIDRKPQQKPKFWNFLQIDDVVTELHIYSEIAQTRSIDWWTGAEGDEVTAKEFLAELSAVKTPEICIRINSVGGDVFVAQAIATNIGEARNAGKKVTCKIDGVCASAAVGVAMAAEKISIATGAYMMIHNPSTMLFGYYEAPDIDRLSAQLEVIKQGIVNIYVGKTGLTDKEISKMMDAQKWFDSSEAVEKGFADEVMTFDQNKVAQNITNVFKNCGIKPPEALKNVINKSLPKGAEEMDIKNLADLKTAYPAFLNEAEQAAKDAGAQAERERIKAIDQLQGKVSNELLNKGKYETFDSAEKIAFEALSSGDVVNTAVLGGLANETAGANAVAGFQNNGNADPAADEAQVQAKQAAEIVENVYGKKGKEGK